MEYASDKIDKQLKASGQSRRRVNWNVSPYVQEESGLVDLTGSVQKSRMVKGINRNEFMITHLKNIRDSFGLSNGQIKILLALTYLYKYKSKFEWTKDSISHVSKVSGLTRGTVSQLFVRLVSRKELIIKIKSGLYQLNEKVLFHHRQIDKCDRVEVTMVYNFVDVKPSMKDILAMGIDIPLGFVEALAEQGEEIRKLAAQVQERYNEQERDRLKREKENEKKIKDKSEKDEQLKKNKWE